MTILARLSAALAGFLAVLAATAAVAGAGSYQVLSCKVAEDDANLAWLYLETGAAGQLEHGDGCSASGEYGGLWVRDTFFSTSGGDSNGDVSGFWRFEAPATTTITALSYARYLRTYDDDNWRSQARQANGSTLESCTVPISDPFCTLGASGGAATSFSDLSTTRLEVGVRCASGSASMFCLNGSSIHKAQATLYSSTVTIDDPQDPAVSALSGSLFGGGWVRGTKSAAMTASDATGVGSLELTRDGGTVVKTTTRTCDYRLPAPCTASGGTSGASAWSDVDTSTLEDGTHSFVGVARDAADNAGETAGVEVDVDNTPPIAPSNVTPQGGVWSAQAVRTVDWVLPGGQVAPITGAQLQVCPIGGGGSCSTPAASTTSAAFTLPAPGAYGVEVKLVDAAGNVTPTGATTTVGYDAGAPPAPQIGQVEGTGGSGYGVAVNTGNDPGPAPIAGLAGEVCPTSGGDCATITASGTPPERATFAVPGPGEYAVAIRSVDAAGNTSPSATTTFTVPVSPTPSPEPSASATAEPSPTASPTTTTTPARTAPAVTLTQVRLTRSRIKVAGALPEDATGTLKITVRARKRKRTRTARITADGTFRKRFPLLKRQRGVKRARLIVAYSGDARYLSRTLRRRARR